MQSGEHQPQKLPHPVEEEREVVAGGQHGVDHVALFAGEIFAAHPVLGLEMADDRLDGREPPHFALDRRGDAALLAAGEDLEPVAFGGIVAAVAGVGEDALDLVADRLFDVRDDGRQRVAVIGIAGQSLRMQRTGRPSSA